MNYKDVMDEGGNTNPIVGEDTLEIYTPLERPVNVKAVSQKTRNYVIEEGPNFPNDSGSDSDVEGGRPKAKHAKGGLRGKVDKPVADDGGGTTFRIMANAYQEERNTNAMKGKQKTNNVWGSFIQEENLNSEMKGTFGVGKSLRDVYIDRGAETCDHTLMYKEREVKRWKRKKEKEKKKIVKYFTLDDELNSMEVKPPITVNVLEKAQNNFLDQDSAHNLSPAFSYPGVGVWEKRKGHQFPELFTSGGKKRKQGVGPVQAKNALVTLNEYKQGLEYVLVEQRGPEHLPVFVIRVTINGFQFVGEGGSKKLAKQAAAEAALKSLIQLKNPLEAQVAMGMSPYQNAIDFTKDTEIGEDTSYEELNHSNLNESSGSAKFTPTSKVPQVGQNPVMTLNEMRPGLSFECSESGSSPATKRFTMKVVIEEKEFEGSGVSKKLAKQAAAKAALTQLYNTNFTNLTPDTDNSISGSAPKKVAGTDLLVSEFSMDQAVADNIGKLILARYDELMVGLPQYSRREVIAGIVMTKDKDMHDMEVISVSTGTKCVNGEYMSVSGTALNDCHAEIISRRCLMEFLYSQLEQVANANGEVGDTILLKSEDGGYKLKENVRFHLYINTAPCGDARILFPHEALALAGEEADRHPNRNLRGQLRTKRVSGEGTIPVKSNDGIQTWDGVMQGATLFTMSCSDKVCRWNVLGVQGSLLSYYLHPVYLHSVVLGSLFHPTHMYRTLAGRIQSVLPSLPENYSLHTLRLNLLSSAEVRQPGKAPNYSVSWTKGRQEVEVVDAMKGKGQDTGKSSRLCKVSMFKRWLELGKCNKLSKIEDLSNPLPSIYNEAKLGSKKFQEVKRLLFKAFKDAELGHWVKKPMEQDDFEVK